MRHDLPPEKASQVARTRSGDEPVGHEKILPTVVVEVDEGGGPAPSAHDDPGLLADVVESSFPVTPEKRVAAGEMLEEFPPVLVAT